MRRIFTTAAIAATVALPLIAGPTGASASCRGRANTGTAIGAVGGALVGNSISHGGGGAIIGGLGGAVLGHQIAKGGCTTTTTRHAYYHRRSSHYARTHGPAYASSQGYYDSHGNYIRR